jgi:hypothetical protein
MLRFAGLLRFWQSGYTFSMRENDWTRILGWPGYKVYRAEIDEPAKRLKLWARRKREYVPRVVESFQRRLG